MSMKWILSMNKMDRLKMLWLKLVRVNNVVRSWILRKSWNKLELNKVIDKYKNKNKIIYKDRNKDKDKEIILK